MKNILILYILAFVIFIKKKYFVQADTQLDPIFFKTCPLGYYIDQEQNCQQCNNNCKECSYSIYYKKNNVCTTCANDYYYDLVQSECVKFCVAGMRTNQLEKTCEKCDILNCSQCESTVKTCTQCKNNYLLTEQQCIYQGEEDLLSEQKLLILIGESDEEKCSSQTQEQQDTNSNNDTLDQFCTQDTNICPIIKNDLDNENLKYIYSLVDEKQSIIYLISINTIQIYKQIELEMIHQGRNMLPNNSIVICGFIESDLNFFYCLYDNNQVIKYNKITVAGESVFKVNFEFTIYLKAFNIYK